MTKEEYKEFIESTIYHELGHILGYILANKNANTELGPIKIMKIGNNGNLVTPIKSFYHIESNINEDIPRLKKETQNIERTIAWFIEVILGCSLQTIFEHKQFKTCFGLKLDGGRDFKNISDLKLGSSFKWNIQEIYELQKELENILIKRNITDSLKKQADKILDKLLNDEYIQVVFTEENIKPLIAELEELISPEFYNEYCLLIKKYKEIFTKVYDLKCEILLYPNDDRNLKYISGHSFRFNINGIGKKMEGVIRFIHKEIAKSGDNFMAEILFDNQKLLENHLSKMMKIEIFNDSKCVGIATVMGIINKDLEFAST